MANEEQIPVDLAQAVKRMKENWPALLEFEKLRAEQAKVRYDNLRNQGFGHEDSLVIIAKAY